MTHEDASRDITHYISNGCCNGENALSWETLNMAISALKKQIPKKPHFEGDGYWNGELVYDTWVCPNCDTDYEVEADKHKYCPNCGQKIDWSEEE